MAEDSGGAGEYRGGCGGTVWEVEPLDHTMTVIAFGEGRQHPTMGAGGAEQISPELKVGRLEILHKDGQTDLYRKNTVTEITLGERARNMNPGGGGSIGHVNNFGMLEVGPQSAGATPGPASYGKGGELPTVTDANLVLGYLEPNAVLGGCVTLDKDKAQEAVQKYIADPLKIDMAHAAFGISAIVNQNMANGIRRITIEKGYDPRDFALICAGGAGGMHIVDLAEEMGIGTILIPKIASCLCAFGQIISDIKYNYLATQMMIIAPDSELQSLNATLHELESLGVQKLLEDGFAEDDIIIERTMEMRYVGQVHECNVLVPNGKLDADSVQTILEAFHHRHKELYTYDERDNKVELVNIEVAIIGRISKPKLPELAKQQGDVSQAKVGSRAMIMDQDYEWIDTPIYNGEAFGAGAFIAGPALIQEPTTTIVIKKGWQAELHETGTYKLTKAA